MPALKRSVDQFHSRPVERNVERIPQLVSMGSLTSRQYELLATFIRLDRLMLTRNQIAEAMSTRHLGAHLKKLEGLKHLKCLDKQHVRINGSGVREAEGWMIEHGELDEETGLPTKKACA